MGLVCLLKKTRLELFIEDVCFYTSFAVQDTIRFKWGYACGIFIFGFYVIPEGFTFPSSSDLVSVLLMYCQYEAFIACCGGVI